MVASPSSNLHGPGSEKLRDPYRVLVVDDSAVIRGLIARWLDADPAISVVATASNGAMAVSYVAAHRPELVILDIEMPVMDGMTALPKLIEIIPDIKIIMASTLTRKNAEISMRALQQGAAEYMPKPETSREINASTQFRQEIILKVKALGMVLRKSRGEAGPESRRIQSVSSVRTTGAEAVSRLSRVAGAPLTLHKQSLSRPRILAIGSSTGGPQALLQLLTDLKDLKDVAVLITQHMPATFTSILAEHLARATGRPCSEARDGEPVLPGHIYVAPGNFHMIVEKNQDKVCLRLNQEPHENFCRPAVDPLFKSVSKCYGSSALGIILTGMGQDGLKGSGELVGNGGTLIAQDEETSVVWGMPGAVSLAGLCSAVLPLKSIGKAAMKLMDGGQI